MRNAADGSNPQPEHPRIQQRTRPVKPMLGQRRQRQCLSKPKRQHTDGNVDQKQPRPRRYRQNARRNRRPRSAGERHHKPREPNRPTKLRARKNKAHQRGIDAHQSRSAKALRQPGKNQHRHGGRARTSNRRYGEQPNAPGIDTPIAINVAKGCERDERDHHCELVAVDHPNALSRRDCQTMRNIRQSNVRNRTVKHRHDHDQTLGNHRPTSLRNRQPVHRLTHQAHPSVHSTGVSNKISGHRDRNVRHRFHNVWRQTFT